jgi:hypothetical protein
MLVSNPPSRPRQFGPYVSGRWVAHAGMSRDELDALIARIFLGETRLVKFTKVQLAKLFATSEANVLKAVRTRLDERAMAVASAVATAKYRSADTELKNTTPAQVTIGMSKAA